MRARPLIIFLALLINALGLGGCTESRQPRSWKAAPAKTQPPPPPRKPTPHGHANHEHMHGSHPHAGSDHHHHSHPHPHLDGPSGHHHPS